MKWKHNQLRDDLAIARDIKFKDVPLGSVWAGNWRGKGKGTQIADALFVRPSYTQFCVSIYEIKVSRADFLSDIRSEKWRGYLNHCHRFYFAVPRGLIDKKEIPREAGLIARSDKTWRTIVQPEVRDIEIPYETMMSLVFKQYCKRQLDAYYYHPDYTTYKKYKKLLGEHIANKLTRMELSYCPACHKKNRKIDKLGNEIFLLKEKLSKKN